MILTCNEPHSSTKNCYVALLNSESFVGCLNAILARGQESALTNLKKLKCSEVHSKKNFKFKLIDAFNFI